MNIGRFIRRLFRKPEAPIRRALPNPAGSGFLCGANLPWIVYGCDFGSNAWQPKGGMSQPDRRLILQERLSTLSDADLRIVRWFMLCDGRAGLRFEEDNVSIDSTLFADVDAALEIAEKQGVFIVFTLFDFHWLHPARLHEAVQLGGRAGFLNDGRLQKRLLENVIEPILTRYGRHPAIHSWDVFNEPEWILRGIGSRRLTGPMSVWTFHKFLRAVVHLIHSRTEHPATLGLAWRRSLDLFDDCSLDFHQVHWYDSQGDEMWTPLKSKAPVVLGEFPTSGSGLGVAEILRRASRAGFAGAWAWSANSEAQSSSVPALRAGLHEFRGTTPQVTA